MIDKNIKTQYVDAFSTSILNQKVCFYPPTHTSNKHCFVFLSFLLSYICLDVLRVIDRHCMPVNFMFFFFLYTKLSCVQWSTYICFHGINICCLKQNCILLILYTMSWKNVGNHNFLYFTTLNKSSLLYLFTIFLLSIQTLVADSLFHFACL